MNTKRKLPVLGAVLLATTSLPKAASFLPATKAASFLPATTTISYLRNRGVSTICNSKPPGSEDSFQDEEGSDEGEDLAKQFYKQVRKREKEGSPLPTSDVEAVSSESGSANSGASGLGQDESTQKADPEYQQPKKKFTGKQLTQRDQQSSFVGDGGGESLFDEPKPQRSPREQMQEREFNLVGRAEAAIPFQAALAFCVLCFYIYVGFTGGIKSETDFSVDEFDDYTEQVIPQPRDTESSYWL